MVLASAGLRHYRSMEELYGVNRPDASVQDSSAGPLILAADVGDELHHMKKRKAHRQIHV